MERDKAIAFVKSNESPESDKAAYRRQLLILALMVLVTLVLMTILAVMLHNATPPEP